MNFMLVVFVVHLCNQVDICNPVLNTIIMYRNKRLECLTSGCTTLFILFLYMPSCYITLPLLGILPKEIQDF